MKTPSPFSIWMRDNLKDAFSGLITQDIDFIIKKPDSHFLIVEEKLISSARTGPAQAVIYKLLNDILTKDTSFQGCHKVTCDGEKLFVNQSQTRSLNNFLNDPFHNYLNSYSQTWFEKIIFFNKKFLWDCKGKPYTKKTEIEHSYQRESKFMPLLKKYSIEYTSIDWIFLNYCTGYFALFFEDNFEEKVYEDTTIRNIIKNFESYNKSDKKAYNPKSNSEYHFVGAYQLHHTENFSHFFINDHRITVDDAIRVLNLDSNEIIKFK